MDEFKNMDKLKDELFEAIGKICKDYKEKHEPEFKVGQWYISKSEGRKDKIYRVCRINGRYIYYDCSNIEGKSNWIAKDSVMYKSSKPATKEQIESHLRKICDEKYIGKKVKCLHCGEYTIINTPHPSGYDKKYDQFWMIASNSDGVCVYEQGKFASIIPDKKKLPKTREEFEVFLNDYDYERAICDDEFTINIYLNEYEIQ